MRKLSSTRIWFSALGAFEGILFAIFIYELDWSLLASLLGAGVIFIILYVILDIILEYFYG
jgi:hypothetical protein